ncbi:hypothetical protein [Flavobacterium psychrotrophum]|uniref:hypothetical protein n=1 Tax=Flavobacterium psychrotrophum TaxID=2294119 RepID=UPI000E31EE4A|nr:hypothetical protein [Flavobacterium psychrotrophum]
MKKIIYLFIVLGALSVTAQTKKKAVTKNATTKTAVATSAVEKPEEKKIFIAKDDVIIQDGRAVLTFENIYFEDYAKNLYPVALQLLAEESQFIDTEMTSSKLNNMMLTAYVNAKYSIANESTFKAKTITIFFYDTYDAWSLNVTFDATGSNGVNFEDKYITFFDKAGVKEMKAASLTKKQ